MTPLDSERNYLKVLQRVVEETELRLADARTRKSNPESYPVYERAVLEHHRSGSELRRVKNLIARLEREAAKPSLIERLLGVRNGG
jgi:hypothetical protein